MTEAKIRYASGGVELLDEIQPFWEQLNQHHARVSPHFAADFLAKTFTSRKNALLKKYADGKIRIDIAQSNQTSVGYLVSVITSDWVGEIESIFIDDGFRGKAIGNQLMQRALDWFDAMNAQTRLIDVAVGNERTHVFYERFEFYPRTVTLKQKMKDDE